MSKKKSFIRSCFAFLVISVFMSGAVPARQEKTDFDQLERVVLDELKRKNTPGAAIAIVSGDRVVYAKGFGVASIETSAPVTPDMLFRLGSTTKMFTAAALVTLADEGRIKLDEPIGSYVQGINPRIARVTVHQLLSNTSGMRDFAAPFISHDDSALANMVRTWKEDVFFTEPGKIYSYSSPGFWLAGFVMEETGKKPYADLMDELLFKPLGMKRTTLRPLMALTYPLATGHAPDESGATLVIRPAFNNVAMWPAGSIYSSVADLSRFAIAMMNGGRLEGRQALRASVVSGLPARHTALPGESDGGYGYGLLTFKHRGVRFVMHGGFSRGYGSMIQIVPERRFALIVVTNKSGETLPASREKALELALSLEDENNQAETAALPVGEKEAGNYIGIYSHHPQTWEIFAREGQLYLKENGVESKLTRTGSYKFSYGQSNQNEIVLVPGADGKAVYLFNGLYSARRVPPGK